MPTKRGRRSEVSFADSDRPLTLHALKRTCLRRVGLAIGMDMKLSVSHLVLGLSLLAHSFALPTQQASCDVHHNPLLGLMELPWNKPEAFAFCKHMLGLDQPIIQTLWRTTTQLHTTTITTTSTQVVPVTVRSGDDGFAPPAWIPWAYRGYEMVQGTCGCLMQGVSRSTKVVTAWKTASTTTTKHQTMTQTVRSTVHTSATTTTSTKPSSQSSSSTPTPAPTSTQSSSTSSSASASSAVPNTLVQVAVPTPTFNRKRQTLALATGYVIFDSSKTAFYMDPSASAQDAAQLAVNAVGQLSTVGTSVPFWTFASSDDVKAGYSIWKAQEDNTDITRTFRKFTLSSTLTWTNISFGLGSARLCAGAVAADGTFPLYWKFASSANIACTDATITVIVVQPDGSVSTVTSPTPTTTSNSPSSTSSTPAPSATFSGYAEYPNAALPTSWSVVHDYTPITSFTPPDITGCIAYCSTLTWLPCLAVMVYDNLCYTYFAYSAANLTVTSGALVAVAPPIASITPSSTLSSSSVSSTTTSSSVLSAPTPTSTVSGYVEYTNAALPTSGPSVHDQTSISVFSPPNLAGCVAYCTSLSWLPCAAAMVYNGNCYTYSSYSAADLVVASGGQVAIAPPITYATLVGPVVDGAYIYYTGATFPTSGADGSAPGNTLKSNDMAGCVAWCATPQYEICVAATFVGGTCYLFSTVPTSTSPSRYSTDGYAVAASTTTAYRGFTELPNTAVLGFTNAPGWYGTTPLSSLGTPNLDGCIDWCITYAWLPCPAAMVSGDTCYIYGSAFSTASLGVSSGTTVALVNSLL